MKLVATAVAMNSAVAVSERGDSLASPQTPCPLVQPPPRRVPKPTNSPAAMMIGVGTEKTMLRQRTTGQCVEQGGGNQSNNEGNPPREITCARPSKCCRQCR